MDGDEGIRILSFDSGGPGSYSQLLIIKEYMTRLAIDSGVEEDDLYPADYFDLMGGVGFGGLIALLLGHLRMDVEQATDALLSVASAVFPDEVEGKPDPETNMKNLKESVEEILQANDISLDMKMNDKRRPSMACKVALYAATSANLSHSTTFRTYPSRSASINPTIVDAICATMATPSFFTPVKIGLRLREQTFVGGAHGTNNPTRELIKEAGAAFGKNRRVAQIISIGSGCPRILSLDQSETLKQVGRLLEDLALDCELVAKELSTRLFSVRAYLRLNVDRGMENIRMEDWTGLGVIETHTSAYVETAAVADALEVSLRRLQERIGTVTVAQITRSSSIKVMAKTAPALSPYYVVRDREYNIMRLHLVESQTPGQKILSITGMGGCGKTQMVSYFLQENQSFFTYVVFVDASSPANIKADIQAWTQSLGDDHKQDVWEDGLRILANGPHNGRWVIIFDNADDPTIHLVPFFPKCYDGTVIITSRNRDVGNLANTYHLELGQMEKEEALSTLLKSARRQLPLPSDELKSAQTLMKELGCLAVALVHAGTYCNQLSSVVSGVMQPYTFTAYLSLFYSQRAALMKKTGASTTLDGYQRGVYTTLDISYQAIPPPIREFLHFISHFHHSDIPVAMLASAAHRRFQDPQTYLPRQDTHNNVVAGLFKLLCVDSVWNELHVQDTIRTLRSFSLLSTTTVADSLFIQMHPLVQAWLRDMPLSNAQEYRAMAQQTLTSCCDDGDLQIHRYLIPHISEMMRESSGYSMDANDQMALGSILGEHGRYHDSEVLFSGALNALRAVSGEETEIYFIAAGWLAGAYQKQGKLEEAERLSRKVLEQCTEILGTENLRTIATSANLAETYSMQGRWEEAEKLQLEVLDLLRRTLGPEDPRTILTAANLAITYGDLGKFNEAERLQLDVLSHYRRTLGMEHPDTILAASNLAVTYSSQGRWDEAEKLELEVLEQRKRILGPEHPHTILAAANLARTYADLGRSDEAEKLELEVLEQRQRVFGMEHPDTISAAGNLARTYADLGRPEEAERLELEVLKQRRKILGTEHPDTILAAANLTTTYATLGRLNDAKNLEQEVLEQRRRVLGAEHPKTILAAVNLSITYRGQEKWEEAMLLLAPAVDDSIKVMGLQHPRTQTNIRALVELYEEMGTLEKAEETRMLLLSQPECT